MTRNYEEQKAAVEYCVAHGWNYALTAVHFGLTSQQVYGWVRRYHTAGLERLKNPKGTAESRKLKATELEFEMERALHQKLRQHRRQNRDAVDLSGVRHTTEYQIVKELHKEKK